MGSSGSIGLIGGRRRDHRLRPARDRALKVHSWMTWEESLKESREEFDEIIRRREAGIGSVPLK
jgi:hypothetical protein